MLFHGLYENPRFVRALIFLGVLSAVLLVCNVFVIGGDEVFNIINTVVSPAAALVTGFLFYLASKNKKDLPSQFLWSMMALGFGLWGLADVIWAYHAIALKDTVPYPSAADYVWVAGYAPLFTALIVRIRTLNVVPSRRQNMIIIGLNTILVLLTIVFIFIPIFENFDSSRVLESFFNITYPLADVGLILLASPILILLKEGRFALIWRLIFSGLMIMTISDLLFSYATWHELYYPDGRVNWITNVIDTTYWLAYICSCLGIFTYRFIWDLDKRFNFDTETLPAERYSTFIATNQENRLITISDNFYCLVDGRPENDYYKLGLGEVLGLQYHEVQRLIQRIENETLLCNERITIVTRAKQTREVWVTAIAIKNADHEFAGVNFGLRAEITVPEERMLPKSEEILGMLNYLLALAGSRPQDEIQTMRVYFTGVIQLLSSMVYQFGGTRFRGALIEKLNQAIRHHNLGMKIQDQFIVFPEVETGKELAPALMPLLSAALDFARKLIGEQIVNEEIEGLEKSLNETILRDLDKYQLRAFHA